MLETPKQDKIESQKHFTWWYNVLYGIFFLHI